MASNFEEDFLKGYRKYEKFFNGWNKKAYSCLGEIEQCGVIEIHRSGRVAIAANRLEIGEDCLENKVWNHQGGFWGFKDRHLGEEFDASFSGHFKDIGAYISQFDQFWISCRTAEGKDIQRQIFFASKDPKIYSSLINNVFFVKKLLKIFNEECNDISGQFQEHMFDMSTEIKDFLIEPKKHKPLGIKKLNELLHDVAILDEDDEITEREWECLNLYCQGKSAAQTSDLLSISRRTVEFHFEAIKKKLKIESKSEILELMK